MKKFHYKTMVVLAVVLLCFCFLASAIPKTEAATETPKTLTNNGTMRYYYYDAVGQQFWTESGSFTVDGSITAICCEHNKSQPYTQTVYESVIENADLAKILYYGTIKEVRWGGFETEEHAVVVTSLLVDAVYNNTTPKGITKGFREWLDTQPPAPTPYIFFYRTSSTSHQDLIGYNPKFEQGTISVQKTDPSGKGLAGAEFKATNVLTGAEFKIGPTNNSGYAITAEIIPYGTYVVEETKSPTGYKLSTQTWTVTVSPENNGAVKFTAVNEPEFGNIQIIKTSSDGRKSGIEFTITGENLTAPLTGKTDAKGSLTFSDLKPGTYTITETVPNKYQSQEPQTVTVTAGQTATVNFANIVKTGTVKGLKVDPSGKPVAGAVIGLFYEDETNFKENNSINTIITGENGVFEFKNVPYGEYIIKELEAPAGYALNETLYPVSIENHGDVIELEIINNFVPKDIEILKVDTHSNPLAGAIFTLETSSDGGETWEIISDLQTQENGVVTFENLAPGTLFRLTETKAPDGFQKLSGPVFQGELDISNETKISFTVVNAPIYELPSTGGNSFMLVTVGSSVALMLCTFFFVNKKKSKVSEYKNI